MTPEVEVTCCYFQVFDREGDDGKFVSVTVKATDQGEPSLEGVCSFTVEITDVNDNPPLFDRQVSRIVQTLIAYAACKSLTKQLRGYFAAKNPSFT